METNTQKELISLKSAAHRLDLSLRGVYRLIARGALPHPVKVGGSSKLFESDLRTYLEELQSQRRQH
jgi:excisionase family DNA binding protein